MSDEQDALKEAEGGQSGDTLDTKFPWQSKEVNGASVTLPVVDDTDIYNMSHRSRGKCYIFNNKVFDSATGLSERRGSDVDAGSLYHCFKEMQFNVTLYHNAKKAEILAELKNVASEDHSDSDCFVCVILTHGDSGTLYGSDGKFCTDRIFEPFLGDMCPSLAGKPKLFFIQACQGDKLDSGVLVRSQRTDSDEMFRIPSFADFLIAYSTVPGFYSWRNTTRGSWFIQALCYVLNNHAKSKDLLEMLTIVNRRVAYDFQSCTPDNPDMHEKKQVPCITFMLTKKIYFFK